MLTSCHKGSPYPRAVTERAVAVTEIEDARLESCPDSGEGTEGGNPSKPKSSEEEEEEEGGSNSTSSISTAQNFSFVR
jgi:hypothetical protein